jgi:hypothetical protein
MHQFQLCSVSQEGKWLTKCFSTDFSKHESVLHSEREQSYNGSPIFDKLQRYIFRFRFSPSSKLQILLQVFTSSFSRSEEPHIPVEFLRLK